MVVGGPITWHNWRSTLLVAVVFGIRLLNYSIFWGWGGIGGLGLGRGENTFAMCIYLYCIIMSFNTWLWYWFVFLVFLHACDIFVCSVWLHLSLFVYQHVFLNYPNCFMLCMYCDICTFVDCFILLFVEIKALQSLCCICLNMFDKK